MGQRALGREAAQPPGYPPRRAFLLNDASMHTPDNTPSLEAVVDRWFRNSRTSVPSCFRQAPAESGFTDATSSSRTALGHPCSRRR